MTTARFGKKRGKDHCAGAKWKKKRKQESRLRNQPESRGVFQGRRSIREEGKGPRTLGYKDILGKNTCQDTNFSTAKGEDNEGAVEKRKGSGKKASPILQRREKEEKETTESFTADNCG